MGKHLTLGPRLRDRFVDDGILREVPVVQAPEVDFLAVVGGAAGGGGAGRVDAAARAGRRGQHVDDGDHALDSWLHVTMSMRDNNRRRAMPCVPMCE